MTTKTPRVLIGVTTYEGKDYIFDKCMAHIAALDYPKNKVDVVIVDNTATTKYFYKLMRRGYKGVYHVARGENSREAITKAQNKIRKILLEGGYDYLFFVESDLLIQPDTLKRLLSYDKPVVGSVYNIARDEKFIPCIFLDDIQIGGFRGTRPLGVQYNEIGKKYYSAREVQEFFAQPGPLVKVHGVGFGATLIKTEVLKDLPFWYDLRFDDKHSDVYFYLDMSRRQIPVYVDITVNVPHFPSDWTKMKDR